MQTKKRRLDDLRGRTHCAALVRVYELEPKLDKAYATIDDSRVGPDAEIEKLSKGDCR